MFIVGSSWACGYGGENPDVDDLTDYPVIKVIRPTPALGWRFVKQKKVKKAGPNVTALK